jgi:hypothetical protein
VAAAREYCAGAEQKILEEVEKTDGGFGKAFLQAFAELVTESSNVAVVGSAISDDFFEAEPKQGLPPAAAAQEAHAPYNIKVDEPRWFLGPVAKGESQEAAITRRVAAIQYSYFVGEFKHAVELCEESLHDETSCLSRSEMHEIESTLHRSRTKLEKGCSH